jgi:hypothetical protein
MLQKVGYWHGETMNLRNCRRARALAWLARVQLDEKTAEWVLLATVVYKGVELPPAVAASLERIERRAKMAEAA